MIEKIEDDFLYMTLSTEIVISEDYSWVIKKNVQSFEDES